MPFPVAFLDASVLYPAQLRDLLLKLAVSDVYHAKWSDAVHEEWIDALRQRRPDIARARLERTRRLMDVHVRDALVSGFEDLLPTIRLPDPDDCHVVAAAIRGEANIILTANLRDFPARALTPHGLVAEHPDRFLTRLCRESLIVSSKPWNASGSGCATPRCQANATSSRCSVRAWTGRNGDRVRYRVMGTGDRVRYCVMGTMVTAQCSPILTQRRHAVSAR